MSARLRIQDLSGEDVDLLLSRSLDGDLSPEDQAELDLALAADPALRHRRDVLRGTVEDLKSLPTPEPPFALATRVNSQVGERIASAGSFWHRFGLYPPPGMVGAAVGVLAVVVVAINFLTPVKRSEKSAVVAERGGSPATAPRDADGPVSVFFSDRKDEAANHPASPPVASADAALEKRVEKKNDVKDAAKAKSESVEAQRVARLKTNEQGTAGGIARPVADSYAPEQPVKVAAVNAPPAPRRDDERQVAAKQEAGAATREEAKAKTREADAVVAGKLDRVETPPERRAAETTVATGRASGGAGPAAESAPAAPVVPKPAALAAPEPQNAVRDGDASRAFAERERRAGVTKRPKESVAAKASPVPPARLHLVSGAGWRLVTPSAPAPTGRYRLYLDLAGKVTAVRTADGGLVSTEVEHQMRVLVFERNGGVAGTDVEIEAR